MSRIYWMVTITGRDQGERFSSMYKTEKLPVILVTLGKGTASSEVLDYLGLEESDKIVLFTAVTGEVWKQVKKGMETKLNIDVPGTGISFIVPVSSMGGRKTLQFLLAGQEFEKEEEAVLKETEYELIIVVSNFGYTNMIMDAAREAGAGGGTVIHAKGTGMEKAEKFLGVSLAAEKEIIFIVARTEKKTEIMKAVMENAGLESKAKSIVFSLPVADTAGLRLSEEWEG